MIRDSDGKQVKGTVLLLVQMVLTSNYDILTNVVQFRPKTNAGLGVTRHGFRTPFFTN